MLATAADAACLGLNCVSDGRHVWVPAGASDLVGALHRHGYQPVEVDLSVLHRGGGSVKCCTQELRRPRDPHPGRPDAATTPTEGPTPC